MARRRRSNREPRCIGCGCSEREPCEPPCGWSESDDLLCTNCETIVTNVLANYFPNRRRAR